MNEKLLEYYAGDEFPAGVWLGKYAYKNNGSGGEQTPNEMHYRMAVELSRAEHVYKKFQYTSAELSEFYRNDIRFAQDWLSDGTVFSYLDQFKYIIPQGSIMSMLGTKTIGSLSNCFVIPPPLDSYGGIFKTDQEIAQLEKRRGGVGTNIDTLRPDDTPVLNAAGSSTGAHSFMDRFSNTTREVAQNGRRGALMLLMSCKHPDIFKFVTKKSDLTKVTGANVSTMLTDEFMKAAVADEDFVCRFPVDANLEAKMQIGAGTVQFTIHPGMDLEYNKLTKYTDDKWFMRIKARELFDLIVEMAWQNGEPGVAFIDRVKNYCPEGVCPAFRPIASNPCGEQWMQAYDACRLLAANMFSFVKNPFKSGAEVDYELAYEVFYIQQRLADDIVDLEIEAVDKIIAKIKADPEPPHVKFTELTLWENIREVAKSSRRTGCGFTGMADMLAALGLKYDSDAAIEVIGKVMKTKMRAELDCTIDLAILRGPFEGWNKDAEFDLSDGLDMPVGKNAFFQMLIEEFPEQAERMIKYGRRNVSWSTVAPTGTVSIVAKLQKYANISAGIEPHFLPYYFRNKKINPSDEGARVDFVDANGDSWQTFPVVMAGLKEWIEANHDVAGFVGIDNLPKEVIEELFKKSPYYGACANDISWNKRIEIQAIVQKYTTNAISSTLNLPKDVSKETVGNIYKAAWTMGLKGVTIYRDGCRDGVLNAEKKGESSFVYKDSIKRPKELDAELTVVSVKGTKYGVIVGLLEEKPYEIFAFNLPEDIKSSCIGKTIKVKKGHYNFVCEDGTLKNIQEEAIHNDELVLTRLVSGMLRHGAKPQFVMEQIDKCDLEVVSFGKAISRVLKKYCTEEEMVSRNTCKNCGSSNLKMQEGCLTCLECGNSKC